MSKILITGASGYAGGRLSRVLTASGHDVTAFVRPTSDIRKLADMGVECRVVDITSREAVMSGFGRFDIVYHIAAAYRAEHVDEGKFERVNVDATRNILEASAEHGAGRVVHCSTVGVQGEIEDPPASEDYRYKPGDHYQRSKMEGELVAREYMEKGLPVCVIRPVGIYGPGETRFLKLFRPISRGRFVMIGSGEVLYHLSYIDDIVQGFVLAGEHPDAVGEIFTIAGPEFTTLNELVAKIARTCGRQPPRFKVPLGPVYWSSVVCDKVCKAMKVAPPLFPRRVEFFELDRAFSIDKARRQLGFDPQYDLDRGLRKTAEWYRERNLL